VGIRAVVGKWDRSSSILPMKLMFHTGKCHCLDFSYDARVKILQTSHLTVSNRVLLKVLNAPGSRVLSNFGRAVARSGVKQGYRTL
jgi:hypothetical protein